MKTFQKFNSVFALSLLLSGAAVFAGGDKKDGFFSKAWTGVQHYTGKTAKFFARPTAYVAAGIATSVSPEAPKTGEELGRFGKMRQGSVSYMFAPLAKNAKYSATATTAAVAGGLLYGAKQLYNKYASNNTAVETVNQAELLAKLNAAVSAKEVNVSEVNSIVTQLDKNIQERIEAKVTSFATAATAFKAAKNPRAKAAAEKKMVAAKQEMVTAVKSAQAATTEVTAEVKPGMFARLSNAVVENKGKVAAGVAVVFAGNELVSRLTSTRSVSNYFKPTIGKLEHNLKLAKDQLDKFVSANDTRPDELAMKKSDVMTPAEKAEKDNIDERHKALNQQVEAAGKALDKATAAAIVRN
jgi:hypothetical protein